MSTGQIDTLRARGVKWIAVAGWGVTLSLAILSFFIGENAFAACGVSALLNILPSYAALKGRFDSAARLSVALMAALQPALLLYAMRGAAWQIDMHMYFFVGLAMLTILCDIRPILLAAATIAAHHLILSIASPDWVFSGGGAIERVLIHALAVVLQAGALCYIASQLHALLTRLGDALEASEASADEARHALELAETERMRAGRLETEQAEIRRSDLVRIGEEFEISIAEVAAAVSQTATTLDLAMASLDESVRDTGRQAGEVANSASAVSTAIEQVAKNVTQLSGSIGSIAVTAGQQDCLATEAGTRTASGGTAVGSLTAHSLTIAQATKAISDIAEKTNLLALNAAIEAASAGDAGRGFAVVAQEVKLLASQAAEATKQIDELLSGVRTGTTEAEQSFGKISDAIKELTMSAAAIRDDAETQRQVATAIEQNADETALGTEGMAKLSTTLAEQSRLTEQQFAEARQTTNTLLAKIRDLESSTSTFVANLRAA